MATPNIVPNGNNEGQLGKSGTQWNEIHGKTIYQNGSTVAPLASPTFTGTPAAPTQASDDNSTAIATTAWANNHLSSEGYLKFGAMTDQDVAIYDSATGEMVNGGKSVTELLARSSHTGQQATSTVDSSPAMAVSGSTSLEDDLVWAKAQFTAIDLSLSGMAASVHTHVSADITDATTSGEADKLIKALPVGGVSVSNSATSGNAISGDTTGSTGKAIVGSALASGAIGVYGFSSTGTTGTAAAAAFAVGASHTERTVLALADSANLNDIFEFGEGTLSSYTVWGFITSKGRPKMKNASGFYQTLQPSSAASSDQTISLPDASGGTLVAGDGSGITDADSFRTSINLNSGDDAVFASVAVVNSQTDGIRFGENSRLAMQDSASTTTWRLPSGGGTTENLIDGDGRGITDASAFRTAIGAASSSGGTYTGTLIIDPSSGSNQLQLIGANGFAATITSNATSSRAVTVPDASGTITLGDGSGITDAGAFRTAISAAASSHTHTASEISDSTAVGRSVLSAATIQDIREDIECAHGAEYIGYAWGYVSSSGATNIAVSGTDYTIEASTFQLEENFLFTVNDSTVCEMTYTASVTTKFRISAAITGAVASGSKDLSFSLSKNGSPLAASETNITFPGSDDKEVTLLGIIELTTNDEVGVMVANDTDTTNFTASNVSITVEPIG